MIKIKKYSAVGSRIEAKNPYWNYMLDEYVMPNGENGKYYYAGSRGSVLSVPILPDGRVLLVQQYRYLLKKNSIEFPGGGMLAGSSPIENATRELQEETGYIAEKLTEIGSFNPCVGLTDEICHVFLAENLTESTAKLDDSEEISCLKLTAEEIENFILSGDISSGMTLAAIKIYNSYLKSI